MKVYRIKISSWTSSFRYPNIISGFQPTLLVPPISTVLGVMNACSGSYLQHKNLVLGYYFDYEAKAIDLERIYQIGTNDQGAPKEQVKSNVIKREFLFNSRLFVYLIDDEFVNIFRNPYYPILLGRSNDLASVDAIDEIVLTEQKDANKIHGQIVPLKNNFLPGLLQALPVYFTNTIPRRNIGTEAFSILSHDMPDFATHIKAFRDTIDNKEVDIYFHNLNFEDNY